jgi:hypothetical protein
VQFGKSASTEPIAAKHAHKVNIGEQQQGAGTEKETALLPKPCDQCKGDGAEVRCQKLAWNFTERRIECVVKCRCCAENRRWPEGPTD